MNSQLQMGTSRADITPAVPVTTNGMGPGNVAKSVESRLEIRAFTFSKGRKAFTLLTCDLLCVDPEITGLVRDSLRPEAVKRWKEWELFISASHTHWGPVVHSDSVLVPQNEEYRRLFAEKARAAAMETFGSLEPVTLELGRTECLMNINRRAVVNGVAFMQPVYPEYTFAAVDRPADREVIVVAGRKKDGGYKGILVNWNCHPICFPIKYDAVSSCFVGRTMQVLREKYNCVCGYTNGALGNAAPLLGLKGAESRDLVANDLASRVSGLLDGGSMVKNTGSVFEACTWQIRVKTYPPGMTYCFPEFRGKKRATLTLGMFRVGQWASGLVPGESFAELAMAFKKRAGVPFPQICSLTNGSYGYMVPEGEFRYGGYEPSVALCAPGEPERLFESLAEHIRK